MGCDKIAYLRGDLISQISIDRFLGYKEALSHYHISFNHDLALVCQNNSIEEGRNKALELLKKNKRFICCRRFISNRCYERISEARF